MTQCEHDLLSFEAACRICANEGKKCRCVHLMNGKKCNFQKKPEKVWIDVLGDGDYTDVPMPKGDCGTCKYHRFYQVWIIDHYECINYPEKSEKCTEVGENGCKKCSIATGMANWEERKEEDPIRAFVEWWNLKYKKNA